ncbi:MAG: plastocyanin/azurin family copper-binding protein [Solirubrobacterales bacterium]
MKKIVALLALALMSAALVACGGGNSGGTTTEATGGEAAGGAAAEGDSATAGSSSTLTFEADPNGQLAFTTTEATTKAGNVTIEFNNPQSMPHDVSIEDSSGKLVGNTEIVTEGSDTATVNLKPGTYTFYCSIPGHREAGMEGTLTVK